MNADRAGGPVFVSHYRRGASHAFVWLSLVLGGGATAATLLSGDQGMVLPAILGLWNAYIFWPMVQDQPVMRLCQTGLAISGLGRIAWSDVRAVRWRSLKLGRIVLEACDLEFAADLPRGAGVASAKEVPLWLPGQIRIWRKMGPRRAYLRLSALGDPPSDIRKAFEHFTGRPAISAPWGNGSRDWAGR